MKRRGAELDIVWHVAAMRELLDVHWRRGELIDRAILRFAKEGVGNLRRVRSAPGDEYILRVASVEVRFSVDREARRMVVWAIWLARRRKPKASRPSPKTRKNGRSTTRRTR